MRLLLALCIFFWAISAQAQLWSSILDPSRAIDWSTAGVTGGIPTTRADCTTAACNLLYCNINTNGAAVCAGGQVDGAQVTRANINAAITSAPANTVVRLPGIGISRTVANGITFNGKSNVTLRGKGANLTILNMTGDDTCQGQGAAICVYSGNGFGPAFGGYEGTANWTGTNGVAGVYTKGATVVTLSSVSALTVGDLLFLDQLDDTSDTGGIYSCNPSSGTCSINGPAGAARPGRQQMQGVRVVSINGTEVTISSPIHMNNWRTGQSPGAWWVGAPVVGVGVEDMTLDMSSGTGTHGVLFFSAAESWVKGIKTRFGGRNHVCVNQSVRITVRDSYFYEGRTHADQSYALESFMGYDSLFENNILTNITTPILMHNSSGNVYGYNFMTRDTYPLSPTWQMPSTFYHAGAMMHLHEGNIDIALIGDQIHGAHYLVTWFRTRSNGYEGGTKSQQTVPMLIMSHARAYNIIANVLGSTGYHNTYQSNTGGGAGNCNQSIYTLGWSGNECGSSSVPQDPLVTSSIMRWGNCDSVTGFGACRFVSSEVPTTGITYVNGNAVPATQVIPPSFYLASKPSWYGHNGVAISWPSIGPDVTGGDIANTGGRAYSNPAKACWDGGTFSGQEMTNFNAATCYAAIGGGDTTPPAAPTNLRFTMRAAP